MVFQRLIINNLQLVDLIKSTYSLSDIQAIIDLLENAATFDFSPLENGLFSAVILDPQHPPTGYHNVWIRDNIHIAHGYYIQNQIGVAIENVKAFLNYFQKHQFRFLQIIDSQVNPHQTTQRPHIRFDGDTLTELPENWTHAQNDALGYFLWFYSKLAHENYLQPTPEDLEIITIFPFYFQAIRYWDDADNGHWEETAKVEASSIGVVVAALKELKKLLVSQPTLISSCQYQDMSLKIEFLDKLITQGTIALNYILPAESIKPESEARRYDSALLFLIYPLQVLEAEIADQIVRDVINNLQGDYGIKRYLGDSYWCADYAQKLAVESQTISFADDISLRNSLLKKGEEAQWCIFDPIISIIFGLKYQQTGLKKYFQQQTYYLNRALGQLTPNFKCPELYYLENNRYIPNPNTPLLWTQANLSIALQMLKSNCKNS